MDFALGLSNDGDFDAVDHALRADSVPAMHHERTSTAFTNTPVYPTPTYLPNRVLEAASMARNLVEPPLENPFGDHAALNSDLDDFLALLTDPFADLERDTRTLVMSLQCITALLSALLSINSLHRSAERTMQDVIPNCELVQRSAIANISLKAALLPLVTQLGSQVFCFEQSLEAYERSVAADGGGETWKGRGYQALVEAARVSSEVENAVRECEQNKWSFHWLADCHDKGGSLDGGAWRTSLALTALVGIHAKLLSLRDAATDGGAGWGVFWKVDLANP